MPAHSPQLDPAHLVSIFAILGSVSVKAVRKMLLKLTPEQFCLVLILSNETQGLIETYK